MPSFTVFKGSKKGIVKGTTQKSDELSGDQVLLRITASGLCGTDLHYKEKDIVLGHEGVGVVEATGPDVKAIQKGDRVGWGYQTDSCGICTPCLTGRETYCRNRAVYGVRNTDQGSFATHAIWREAFLHKIPDNMSDEAAAPLQCGGATVFAALQGVKPAETVAIMGVGGLGHLAIQFAAKLGCRVVVLSGSDRKRDDALKLGAHKFVATKNNDTLDDGWAIDRLLVTTSAQPEWNKILPMMAPSSTIYPLSVASGNLEIPYMPLILQGIAIQGSLVAPRAIHRQMLTFAALHDIAPIVETLPMTEAGITEGMEKLTKGNVHYRAVLLPKL
ncbi:hypothetical protein SEUCBS139899_003622 [Sporothrix eucalyptigena]|uniref:Enoyl reductase (ER) domain-containing protein n=1 Tax=Sporothrix eucalyptigena TaxID=1812306 RepID=A0ABP0C8K3_9PEZI